MQDRAANPELDNDTVHEMFVLGVVNEQARLLEQLIDEFDNVLDDSSDLFGVIKLIDSDLFVEDLHEHADAGDIHGLEQLHQRRVGSVADGNEMGDGL